MTFILGLGIKTRVLKTDNEEMILCMHCRDNKVQKLDWTEGTKIPPNFETIVSAEMIELGGLCLALVEPTTIVLFVKYLVNGIHVIVPVRVTEVR